VNPTVTLRLALADPQLLGGAQNGASWQAWRVLLIAAMGEALSDNERGCSPASSDAITSPRSLSKSFGVSVGRRGGKTRARARWRLRWPVFAT
jgi:hypothetical protein